MASGTESGLDRAIVRLDAGQAAGENRHGSRVRRGCELLLAWIDRRRQLHALDELDDRLLRDIGLTREEARREVAKPFWPDV